MTGPQYWINAANSRLWGDIGYMDLLCSSAQANARIGVFSEETMLYWIHIEYQYGIIYLIMEYWYGIICLGDWYNLPGIIYVGDIVLTNLPLHLKFDGRSHFSFWLSCFVQNFVAITLEFRWDPNKNFHSIRMLMRKLYMENVLYCEWLGQLLPVWINIMDK